MWAYKNTQFWAKFPLSPLHGPAESQSQPLVLETRKSSEWRRNFPAQLKQADFAGPLRGAELHEVLQGGETPCNVIRAGGWSLLLPFCESTLPRVAAWSVQSGRLPQGLAARWFSSHESLEISFFLPSPLKDCCFRSVALDMSLCFSVL